MKPTRLLTTLLRKNAATSAQMSTSSEAETAGLGQSPTQSAFARLMAQKPGATVPSKPPVSPSAPAPSLAKTLPAPANPIMPPTPTNVTSPMTGK